MYFHLFDHTSTKIFVHNNTDHAIKISLFYRLGCVTELPYKNYFAISANLDIASILPTLPTIFYDRNGISIALAGDLETKLSNGIKIYKNKQAVDAITRLVDKYPSICEFLGFMQIPPEHWMKVHLKPGWETKVSTIKPRVYLLGIKAKRLFDKTFDKMQRLGYLKYTTSHTLFSFLVFVIYKTKSKSKKKRHAVVDICQLNALVILDAYSLLLQSDIIASIQECTNLAVLDAALFFYQWLLHPNHWYMFTIVTHQEQKTFQVPIMRYINLVT